MRGALSVLVPLAMVGCASSGLTRAGEAVRVTENPDIVRGCEYVAEVGVPGGGDELRNEAGRLGANFVLRIPGATPRSEAYLCADEQ